MKTFWTRRTDRFARTALPHLGLVYQVARQLADAHTAEDLVQETYLRAWKYFHTFDPATNCRAWLLRILHNVWNDRCRHFRLEIPLPENEATSVEPYYEWEDGLIRNELSEEVGRALSELPGVFRWAVILADVGELSYQEIAELMSCPIGTVMSRINRGRRMLARLLRSYAEEAARASDLTKKAKEKL